MKELVGTMGIVYPAMFTPRGPGNRLNSLLFCVHLLPLWSLHLLDQDHRHVGEDLSTDKCILCCLPVSVSPLTGYGPFLCVKSLGDLGQKIIDRVRENFM